MRRIQKYIKINIKKNEKFAKKLEKKNSNIYNIKVLWKRDSDLDLIFSTNSQERLD